MWCARMRARSAVSTSAVTCAAAPRQGPSAHHRSPLLPSLGQSKAPLLPGHAANPRRAEPGAPHLVADAQSAALQLRLVHKQAACRPLADVLHREQRAASRGQQPMVAHLQGVCRGCGGGLRRRVAGQVGCCSRCLTEGTARCPPAARPLQNAGCPPGHQTLRRRGLCPAPPPHGCRLQAASSRDEQRCQQQLLLLLLAVQGRQHQPLFTARAQRVGPPSVTSCTCWPPTSSATTLPCPARSL